MRSESNQDEAPIESHSQVSDDGIDDTESQNSFRSRGDFAENDYGSESEDNSNEPKTPEIDTRTLGGLIKSVNAASHTFQPVARVVRVI